jgi:hypothetical protein
LAAPGRADLFGLQTPRTAATGKPQALANAAKFAAPAPEFRAAVAEFLNATNPLTQKTYLLTLLTAVFRNCLLQAMPANSYMLVDETWRYPEVF